MNQLPTTKAESLAQFKSWLASKWEIGLPEFDEFLRAIYSTTLKESLAEHWHYLDIGYVSYVITEGVEDELREYLALC